VDPIDRVLTLLARWIDKLGFVAAVICTAMAVIFLAISLAFHSWSYWLLYTAASLLFGYVARYRYRRFKCEELSPDSADAISR
jgi:hypothetical protein